MLTTIVCTLNEELHIGRCVASAVKLGQIFVVDCGSSDSTVEAAAAAGATVIHQPWLGYAAQKNWALDSLPISTEWVLLLDADEYLTSELSHEARQVVDDPEASDGYYISRRNVFLGRELKHVWWYPDYQLRLFRHGRARFEPRSVHEFMNVSGDTAHLVNPLVHENLKGITAFLERHVLYAQLEAQELYARESGEGSSDWTSLPGWRAKARRAVKDQVWSRWPHRPMTRFLYLYVGRRGFLDGRQGRVFAQLIAAYESMIDAYLEEERAGTEGRSR